MDETRKSGETIPKRRTRASGPKVRTGCLTCKVRRVKCDETKPSCKRCTNTGRTCNGYGMQTFTVAPCREPAFGGITPVVENAALEYFYRRTVPQLSVFFDRSFWRGCVLHSSLTEPAIRHAVAAIGALHEAQRSTASPESCQGAMSMALALYNKAIHAVAKKASEESRTLTSVIIGSIIFSCFEFLRGDVNTAVLHISNGIKLLSRERGDRTSGSGAERNRMFAFESTFVQSELAPILSSFYIATAALGQSTSHYNPSVEVFVATPISEDGLPTLLEPFMSVKDARSTLVDLIVYGMGIASPRTPIPAECQGYTLAQLKVSITRWKDQFDNLVTTNSRRWGADESSAADFICVMWYAAKVSLASSFGGTEMAWDAHKADFETMLQLSESLLKKGQPFLDETLWDFSCELGILTPLYTIAWKCRYPMLRRRALDLILKSPQREILYDTCVYHAVYTRVMELEESALGLSPENKPSEDWLPPESARIQHFFGEPVIGADTVGYNIKFLTKSPCREGEWDEQSEYLDLGGLRTIQLRGQHKIPLPVLNLM